MIVKIRKPTGESITVKVASQSEAFDQADKMGPRSLVDSAGERFIKLAGEWYGI